MKSIRSDQLIELGCVEQLLLEFYARWLILSRQGSDWEKR